MLKKADVAAVLALIPRAATYKGRKFKLEVKSTYHLNNGDLIAYGGSLTEVTFIQMAQGTMRVVDARQVMPDPITHAQNLTATIPANVMVVEWNRFCGKDLGFTFIVAPQSEFLPPTLATTTPPLALPAHTS